MSNRRRRRPPTDPGTPDPIITDPQNYNEAEHTTIKLLALALVDADLARDEALKLALMPGPHINDLGNVIDILTRVSAALIRSKVGDDAEAQRHLMQTFRHVVLEGAGL